MLATWRSPWHGQRRSSSIPAPKSLRPRDRVQQHTVCSAREVPVIAAGIHIERGFKCGACQIEIIERDNTFVP